MNQLTAIRAFEHVLSQALNRLVEEAVVGRTENVGCDRILAQLSTETVPKPIDEVLDTCLRSQWQFGSVGYPIQNSGLDKAAWRFSTNLGSAQLVCPQCGDGGPQTHDSGWRHLDGPLTAFAFEKRASGAVVQVFVLPYQCQNCVGEPIAFQVRREDYRLTLTGNTNVEIL